MVSSKIHGRKFSVCLEKLSSVRPTDQSLQLIVSSSIEHCSIIGWLALMFCFVSLSLFPHAVRSTRCFPAHLIYFTVSCTRAIIEDDGEENLFNCFRGSEQKKKKVKKSFLCPARCVFFRRRNLYRLLFHTCVHAVLLRIYRENTARASKNVYN